jgi:hypothetical protein
LLLLLLLPLALVLLRMMTRIAWCCWPCGCRVARVQSPCLLVLPVKRVAICVEWNERGVRCELVVASL